MALRPELLAILVCPVPECRAPLLERGDRLVCTRCGLAYRTDPGWPVLIPDQAERPAPPPPAASPGETPA